ncbi:MAG: PIN domain-containing protein [Goleter apudmare HA4340-LM2]|nr:PIN domain-containing protein [Goleter apudmare HA4340-LM2]
MPKVILDACVLFPMYLRDILLSTAEAGLYRPYWSQKILDEAMGNLIRKGKISVEKARNLEEIITTAFPEAMVTVPLEVEEMMTNDPKDRHVLAAGVIAQASILVTNNITDFDVQSLNPWNMTAQTPDDFLSDLFDNYPEDMVEVVRQQSQNYRKTPLSVIELLDLLSKVDGANLPNFTSRIRFFGLGDNLV